MARTAKYRKTKKRLWQADEGIPMRGVQVVR